MPTVIVPVVLTNMKYVAGTIALNIYVVGVVTVGVIRTVLVVGVFVGPTPRTIVAPLVAAVTGMLTFSNRE
jgi:hypothetical protein